MNRRKLWLTLGAIYLIWGGSYVVTRIGVRHLPPFLFGGLRFIAAGIVLWVVSHLLGNRPRLDRQEFKHLWWVGLGTVAISNGSNVWSMQWLASNQSALLNASAALWIAVLSAFGPRAHALDRRTLAGLLIGFAGIAMVLVGASRPSDAPGRTAWLPELVTLLGVLGWSLATVYLRNYHTRLDILSFTGGQMFLGGLVLTTIALVSGEWSRWQWSSEGLAAFLYMIFMSSVVAYTAYGWLAKNATPIVVGSYSYVAPGLAALLGWWLLDEHLTVAQIIGMLVILAGVALANWPSSGAAAHKSGATPHEGHSA